MSCKDDPMYSFPEDMPIDSVFGEPASNDHVIVSRTQLALLREKAAYWEMMTEYQRQKGVRSWLLGKSDGDLYCCQRVAEVLYFDSPEAAVEAVCKAEVSE